MTTIGNAEPADAHACVLAVPERRLTHAALIPGSLVTRRSQCAADREVGRNLLADSEPPLVLADCRDDELGALKR